MMKPIQFVFTLWIACSVIGFGAITIIMILEIFHSNPPCP